MKAADLEQRTDRELLSLAQAAGAGAPGRQAVSVLLERYQDRVYIWCYRIVRDHERALDLAQETLISAFRKLDGFEGRSGFSSWLFVIARNRCLSALRRPSPWEDDDAVLETIPDPSPTPDEELERRIDEESMMELIRESLDPMEREALWLRCYEGLPVDEITRLLRIDAATGARAILQRARRRLRAALSARDNRARGGSGAES